MTLGFDWDCPCGEHVQEQTCAVCGQWQCSQCRQVVPSKTGCPRCHLGKVHEARPNTTLRLKIFKAGVLEVYLEAPDGERRSPSWREGQEEPDPEEPFLLAPGRRNRIAWKVRGRDFSGGELEVSCRCHAERGPVWRRELSAEELAAGSCEWDGRVEDPRGDLFPDGLLTTAHAPYLLELAGFREGGLRAHPPQAYTRFEAGPWLELLLEDDLTGEPVPGEAYEVTLPGGEVVRGELDARGHALLTGMDPGECEVRFPDLDGDAWGRKTHFLEIVLRDDADRRVPGERYRVVLPDGSERAGELDARGEARLTGIAQPGLCQVSFPDLDGEAWERGEDAPDGGAPAG